MPTSKKRRPASRTKPAKFRRHRYAPEDDLLAACPEDAGASAKLLVRARQQRALGMLAGGATPDQIALALKIDVRQASADIAAASDRLVKLYTCPPQHTFVRYAVFQLGIIRRLQRAVERFEQDTDTVQYNSIVSALKAQSDAYDRILDKGLAFGVIERRQASQAIRQTPADIKNTLKQEILTLSRLLDEVDLSVQFHARRKALAASAAIQTDGRYVPIIRKPLLGPHGVIKVVPDWKYRRDTYTRRADGKYTNATSRATPEQLQLRQLQQEVARLTSLLPTRHQQDSLARQTPEQAQQTILQAEQKQPSQQQPQPSGWLQAPSR